MNWLEMQEPGYEPFEIGHLAQLQNVQVSYPPGTYPQAQLSLEPIYNHEGMMPAQNSAMVFKDEYSEVMGRTLGSRKGEGTWVP